MDFMLHSDYISFMKILIVYASRRGTTRKIADIVSERLEAKGYLAEKKKASTVKAADLLNYDILLLGSSTWEDGDLHEDMDQIERDLRDLDLKGKYGAAFGTGNSRFRYFCEAVDILETRLKHCGAELLLPSLKSDIMEKKLEDESEEWAKELLRIMEQKSHFQNS